MNKQLLAQRGIGAAIPAQEVRHKRALRMPHTWSKACVALLLFSSVLPSALQGQSDSMRSAFAKDYGVYPKQPDETLYNFKVGGVYRFFSTYTANTTQYVLNPVTRDTARKKSIFVGDDSQLPNLTLNFSGRPDKKTAWGFDLYVFQFMDGNIKPTYGVGQVSPAKRAPVFSPRVGTRLGSNMGLLLGMNLYGSMETALGTFSVKTGGIHWASISDLTLAGFTGYNRFILFERNPWDPITGTVSKRYSKYYASGNINQDTRWGERAFTGTIIEATGLPKNLGLKLLYGKTELNGGFLTIPNLSYGGQLRHEHKGVFFAFNTFNNITYTDSLNNEHIGFNIGTLETRFSIIRGIEVKAEAGFGRYYNPYQTSKWGEAINAKIFFSPKRYKVPLEMHFFRVSPNVVNNNAIFWNVAVQEVRNNIPAGSVGSSAVLLPFASAITAVGQFTNNRQGINLNTEWHIGKLKLSVSNAISGEIEALTSLISFTHPVNQFTRSRFWRWTFPAEVGPYQRYNKIYRDVYDKVNLSDTAAKRFNTLEFQAKHHTRLWLRDLYINMIGNYSSVQSKWSPFTVFNETAYLRHYSTQLEAYYALTSRLVLAQYAGYERMICNYKTETDAVTGRPRNQQGWGYAIGIDYDIARNTALFVRHRWFGFEDFSFQNDIYKGREIVVELKVAF